MAQDTGNGYLPSRDSDPREESVDLFLRLCRLDFFLALLRLRFLPLLRFRFFFFDGSRGFPERERGRSPLDERGRPLLRGLLGLAADLISSLGPPTWDRLLKPLLCAVLWSSERLRGLLMGECCGRTGRGFCWGEEWRGLLE